MERYIFLECGFIDGSRAACNSASEQRHCICAVLLAKLLPEKWPKKVRLLCGRMGKVYNFLGLTVGVVQEQYARIRRQAAFRADITYVTSNALGFTYLQDTSIAMSAGELVS
jgi:hypothetical protein